MNMNDILKKIERLEYHHTLMLKMISNSQEEFYKLVIENSLSKEEVDSIYKLCEGMIIKLEEQKAEGFVYFHPLYEEFKIQLNSKIDAEKVVKACLKQGLFKPLMSEFNKYIG